MAYAGPLATSRTLILDIPTREPAINGSHPNPGFALGKETVERLAQGQSRQRSLGGGGGICRSKVRTPTISQGVCVSGAVSRGGGGGPANTMTVAQERSQKRQVREMLANKKHDGPKLHTVVMAPRILCTNSTVHACFCTRLMVLQSHNLLILNITCSLYQN